MGNTSQWKYHTVENLSSEKHRNKYEHVNESIDIHWILIRQSVSMHLELCTIYATLQAGFSSDA